MIVACFQSLGSTILGGVIEGMQAHRSSRRGYLSLICHHTASFAGWGAQRLRGKCEATYATENTSLTVWSYVTAVKSGASTLMLKI